MRIPHYPGLPGIPLGYRLSFDLSMQVVEVQVEVLWESGTFDVMQVEEERGRAEMMG
jgi:hypothetical protein